MCIRDRDGITIGVRYDGKQRMMDIEGTVLTSDMPEQGAPITFTIQTDVSPSQIITGFVEDVTESGRNGDYVSFKATVAQWDSIANYTPVSS